MSHPSSSPVGPDRRTPSSTVTSVRPPTTRAEMLGVLGYADARRADRRRRAGVASATTALSILPAAGDRAEVLAELRELAGRNTRARAR